jgi:hypothetical protein
MAETSPAVWVHYEIRVRVGDPVVVSVLEGRDSVGTSKDGGKMVITLKPDAQTTETVVIPMADVSLLRMTRIEPVPTATTDDAGSIRLVS